MTEISPSQPMNRRKFLKTGCLTAAAVGIVACGGLSAAATYTPTIDMPSITSGETTMNDRILIAYATKAGSTAEIAVRMGEILSKKGLAVDILPVKKVTDVTAYREVILGSAIRIGSLLPEMMDFIKKNQAALQAKPLGVFIGCMTLKDDTEETRKTVGAYLEPVQALVKPTYEGLFAGVMDLKKLNLLDRMIINIMKAPVGDFRRWDQIEGWAQSTAG
jgi:menaquinone-dependent protoporphyrinogen oxidase